MDSLIVNFNSAQQYQKAVKHFENRSEFYASEYNDALRMITFEEEASVDALEMAISEELEEYGITNYWFSSK